MFAGLSKDQMLVIALLACDASYKPRGQSADREPLQEFFDSKPLPVHDVLPEFVGDTILSRENDLSHLSFPLLPVDPSGAPVSQATADNWMLAARIDHVGTGFGASIFVSNRLTDENGVSTGSSTDKLNVIVALEGSSGPDPIDWYQNIDHARNVWRHSREALLSGVVGEKVTAHLGVGAGEARDTANKLRVLFTGQSLGGALAQYAAFDYAYERSSRVRGSASSLLGSTDGPLGEDIYLVTFNGFGAERGIRDVMKDRSLPFDPLLLVKQGVPTEHYAIENDLVYRIGSGHLQGVGKNYRLEFRRFDDGVEATGPRNLLNTVDAHRIESGYYRGFRNHQVTFDSPLTKEARFRYLDTTSMQAFGTLFSRLFDKDAAVSGNVEAMGRIMVGFFGVLWLGGPLEARRFVSEIAESLYRSKDISWPTKIGLEILGFGKAIGGIAMVLAQPTPLAWVPPLVAALADLFKAAGSAGERAGVNGFLSQFDKTLPDGREVKVRLSDNYKVSDGVSDQERAHRLAVLAALADPDETMRQILATPSKVRSSDGKTLLDGYARAVESFRFQWTEQDVAQLTQRLTGGQNWRTAVLEYVGALAGEKGLGTAEISRIVSQVAAMMSESAAKVSGESDYGKKVLEELLPFMRNLGWKVGELRDSVLDMPAADGGVDLGTPRSLDFTEFRELADVFVEETTALIEVFDGVAQSLGEAPTAGEVLGEAIDAVRAASQKLAITAPGDANPFGRRDFDPVPGADPIAALGHGRPATLMIHSATAAGEGGQRVALSIRGSAADKLIVSAAGQALEREEGRWYVDIPEGRSSVAVSVHALDQIAAAGSVELVAELVGAQNNPLHLPQSLGRLGLVGIQYAEATASGDAGAAQLVFGTGRADGLVGGGGDDLVAGAGDDDTRPSPDGLAGFDYIDGDDPREFYDAALGEALAGNDRLYGDSVVADLAAYLDSPADAGASGQRGDWIRASRGRDLLVGGGRSDLLFGGWHEDVLIGGGGDDLLNGDDNLGVIAGTESQPAEYGIVLGANPFDPAVTGSSGLHFVDLAKDGGSADILHGGTGDDILLGMFGDDLMFGGDGRDTLAGAQGGDTLYGGAGDDRMAGDWGRARFDAAVLAWPGGNDVLDGGAGADWMLGEYGNDVLYGGSGDDQLFGDTSDAELQIVWAGDDLLDGGDGNDVIAGGGGRDELYGGAGDDTIFADADAVPVALHGDDRADAGAGNDYLRGFGGHDSLFGGAGNDALLGETGNDTLHGGEGDDILDGGENDDRMFAGAGNDTAQGGAGHDRIAGDGGDDQMLGDGGDDVLDGGLGDDILDGGEGRDVLAGGEGADLVSGGAGADVLEGGRGTDGLAGGEGDDTYVLALGDSPHGERVETIEDYAGRNVLRFAQGVSLGDFRILRSADPELLVLAYSSEDRVAIPGGYRGAITRVEFGDGTSRTMAEIIGALHEDSVVMGSWEPAAALAGGAANDTLQAMGDDAEVSGGRGNDTITVGGLDARIHYGLGDGTDALIFSTDAGAHAAARATHRVVFAPGVEAEDVWFDTASRTVRIGADADDRIRFDGFDWNDPLAALPLGAFEFADGTTLAFEQFLTQPAETYGTREADSLRGTRFEDRLFGYGGADTLSGGHGNDTLDGGAGDDTLEGGNGDDTYLFSPGAGTDTLRDAGGHNRIVFSEDIALSTVQARSLLSTTGARLLSVRYADNDEIVLSLDSTGSVPASFEFAFANGERWSAPALVARSLGRAMFHVTFEGAADVAGGGFDDILWGGAEADHLAGGAGSDELAGAAGADTLLGEDGDDVIVGGTGDDLLSGGHGRDTYRFFGPWGRDRITETLAGESVLEFAAGVGLGDLELRRVGDDAALRRIGAADSVALAGFFAEAASAHDWWLHAADGQWRLRDVLAQLLPEPPAATVAQARAAFGDRVRAFFSEAVAAAGYVAEGENFVRTSTEEFSNATVRGFERFAFREAAEDVSGYLVPRQALSFSVEQRQSQRVGFEMRTLRLGAQTVGVGRAGDVSMLGGGGVTVDPVPFVGADGKPGKADGNVEPGAPYAFRNPATGALTYFPRTATLVPTASGGITPSFTYQHEIRETRIDYQLTLALLSAGAGADVIEAGTGFNRYREPFPFAYEPVIVDAGEGHDIVRPSQAGSYRSLDALTARARHPGVSRSAQAPGAFLFGNGGDDALQGTLDDDVLVGGTGNDVLAGGPGNDEYLMFEGDGQDIVFEAGATVPGVERNNVLVLPAQAREQDLRLAFAEVLHWGPYEHRTDREGTFEHAPHEHAARTLYGAIDLAWGTADGVRILLPHAQHGAGLGIDVVRFGDGSEIRFETLLARVEGDRNPQNRGNVLVADAAGDVLAGMDGDDRLLGQAGDDTLFGGAGRDTLEGGAGNDVLLGAQFRVLRGQERGDRVVSDLWDDGNVYRGGHGEDVLWGTAGEDTFEFGQGDGWDEVRSLTHEEGDFGGFADPRSLAPDAARLAALQNNADLLRFGPGIRAEAVRVTRAEAYPFADAVTGGPDANDLLLEYDGPWNSVRVKNWFDPAVAGGYRSTYGGAQAPHQVRRVAFADGTEWNLADILARVGAAAPAFTDNRAPQARPGATLALRPGQPFESLLAEAAFEDPDSNDYLTVTSATLAGGDPLPDWMRIDANTGLLTGTAPEAGEWTVSVAVYDRGFLAAESQLRVIVLPPNRPPRALEPSVHVDAAEGAAWSLAVRSLFEDPDEGDRLSVGITGDDGNTLPAWLHFDPLGGILSGTPGPLDVRSVRIDLVATDLAGDSAQTRIDVAVAAAPGQVRVGTMGDDTLVGTSSADTFDGGGGHDAIAGFGGDDHYRWSAGDGLDRITDTSGQDTLAFGAGIRPGDLSVRVVGSGADADARIRRIDAGGAEVRGEGIDIVLAADGSVPIEHFAFSGGELLGAASLLQRATTAELSAASPRYTGTATDDTLRVTGTGLTAAGGPGNDVILVEAGSTVANGEAGDDYLEGGAKEDYLTGGEGNDVLSGGAGHDSLRGGPGSNAVFGGSGHDWMFGASQQDFMAGGEGDDHYQLARGRYVIAWRGGDGLDSLEFVGNARAVLSFGIDPGELSLSRSQDALVLSDAQGGGVRLEDWFARFPRRHAEALQLVSVGAHDSEPQARWLDLPALAERFEQAQQSNPGVSRWALTDALLEFQSREGTAYGGDLAMAHAAGPLALASASIHRIGDVLADRDFASAPQRLQGIGSLREGGVVLSVG